MNKKPSCPAWFTKLASELARRNTGAIDVSVAQCSEILGHLCDILGKRRALDALMMPEAVYDLAWKMWKHGQKRLAAAKRKR